MACDLITRNSARYSAGVEKEGRGVERGHEWYFMRGVGRGPGPLRKVKREPGRANDRELFRGT